MAARGAGNGWDRVEVNFRLGKARVEKLRSLAARLPPGASPTQALELAIDLAAASHGGAAGRLGAVEDAIEALRTDQSFDAARLEAAIGSVASSVQALRDLISGAIAEGDG